MKEILFYSFLIIFILTAIVTLLGITRLISIDRHYLKILFGALIVELISSMIILFNNTDFTEDCFVRYVKPNQQEYIWKEADIRFCYPRTGWVIDTKGSQGGLGDLAIVAANERSTQIKVHYSALDPKYVDKWELFLFETKNLWERTLKTYDTVIVHDIYIDGCKGFRLKGKIPGSSNGYKKVDIIYAPINNEFFIEVHYTRNEDAVNVTHDEAYEIILSTLLIEK